MTLSSGNDKTITNPEDHPLYEEQVNFELEMRDGLLGQYGGAAGYRRMVERAKGIRGGKQTGRSHMTALRPYRAALERWIPHVAEGIKHYCRDAGGWNKKTAGPTPVAYHYLKDVDPYKAAFITIRTVLDRMVEGRATVHSCAVFIGSELEHEEQMVAWERRDPDLYHKVQRGLDDQHATPIHRRRVNINRFNKLCKERFEWVEWDRWTRTAIGFELLNILMMHTGQFTVEDGEPTERRDRKPQKVLVLDAKTAAKLAKGVAAREFLSPIYMPTLMPPKRWGSKPAVYDDETGELLEKSQALAGGYYTPFVRQVDLVHFRASQPIQQRHAREEYEALDMPKVYEALHAIQETPWKINQKVYAVAKALWELQQRRSEGRAGLPGVRTAPPVPKPASAPDTDDPKDPAWLAWRDTDEGKQWMRKRAIQRNEDAIKVHDILITKRILSIAERLGTRTFYFPHKLDFRGRTYPIPVDLQPQGGDLARGLLTFANGKPVDAKGRGWLAVHLANVCGKDKISFAERIDWVYENEDRWQAIWEDPVGNRKLWMEEDDCWQVLAAAMEFMEASATGDGYVSSLPIRVDGTCNGIQHLSALQRDEKGAMAVNLVPDDHPHDIYQIVADALQDRLEDIEGAGGENGPKATWALDLCEQPDGERHIPRSFTKRQVMVLPYGGTFDAFKKYTREWVKKEHPKLLNADTDYAAFGKALTFTTQQLFDIVKQEVSSAMEVMRWVQQCARVAAVGNQPIYWTTPSGFVVRHFYGKQKSIHFSKKLEGQRFQFTRHVVTETLDRKEQVKGIAPNFIHSLDASALMDTVCMARAAGVDTITTIHDAYGTVAADMDTLYEFIREAFVRTHEADMLAVFRHQCQVVLADHIHYKERMPKDKAWARADKLLPKPLKRGTLDIELVRQSEYFFS